MASENGVPVELYIYDLTHGLASLLSPAIIGRQIDGIWHTAVVVYDREFFYGSGGIISCAPGSTQLGAPHQVQPLGETFVPFHIFVDYLQGLATTTYTGSSYNLLEHNCNNFTDEIAQFLCGAHCPKHILSLPETVLSPTQRTALQGLLDGLLPNTTQASYAVGVRQSRRDSPDYLHLNTEIEEARMQSQELEQRRNTLAEKVARKERKKEKKKKKLQKMNGTVDSDELDQQENGDMAEAVEVPLAEPARAGPSSQTLELEEDDRRVEEQKKRNRDPPIVYKEIDGTQEYEALAKAISNVELSPEEKQSLDELQQYLVQGEGSWALGDDFLLFIGRILSEGSIPSEVRVCALRCLAAAALRDDISLLLHQDRRDHALMNYAITVDSLPLEEQRALTLFMCNLFENISSSEWLLYISEWEKNGQPLSNIRATTKVAVHSSLSEDGELREVGTALMHNIATKEVKTVVFDEVCVELAMAVLQILSVAPGEEHLYRAVKALARLAYHSAEVPQLISIVGPHPDAYRGTSPRIDEQIDLIMVKVK